MNGAALFLLLIFFFGLLMLVLLAFLRAGTARRVIFILTLVLVNLGLLGVLAAVFLVSRLEGSMPPGVGMLLAPLGIPIVLILALDAALVLVFQRFAHRGGKV